MHDLSGHYSLFSVHMLFPQNHVHTFTPITQMVATKCMILKGFRDTRFLGKGGLCDKVWKFLTKYALLFA